MTGKTHRELYPEQYNHPLIGQTVQVKGSTLRPFVVKRVCPTPFGWLVVNPKDHRTAYPIDKCEVQP